MYVEFVGVGSDWHNSVEVLFRGGGGGGALEESGFGVWGIGVVLESLGLGAVGDG